MNRLEGKRVLVVGASRGIGKAIGLAAGQEGASVAFAARSTDRLDAAADECPGRALAVPCDARDEASCQAAVARTVDAFGGLDALVYSTGTTVLTELKDASYDDWREVFETNLIGAAAVTAAAVEPLRAASGHAIYLSSESALYRPVPWRGIGLYIASKVALESMVRSWHLEIPEVAFTTYVVGATMSEFASDQADDLMRYVSEWYEHGYVKDRVLEPEVHARAVIDILTSPAWFDTVAVRVK